MTDWNNKKEVKIIKVQTRILGGADDTEFCLYNSSKPIRSFHSNGELKYIQRFNTNGTEQGLWEEFDENGQPIMSITFENGKWIETILEISIWKPIKYVNIYSKSLPIYTRHELQQ